MTDTRLLDVVQDLEERAERVRDQDVMETYVNANSLVSALSSRKNGVIFGRRGTGKTHALRYLSGSERQRGNRVIFIDIERDVGSTEGHYSDNNIPLAERATRLIVDVLGIVHRELLEAAYRLDLNSQISALEAMIEHFSEVRVAPTEVSAEAGYATRSDNTSTAGVSAGFSPLGFGGSGFVAEHSGVAEGEHQAIRLTGPLRHRVHFGGVTAAMRAALEGDDRRTWIIIDEWSAVPLDVQPYLAEMLRKLFFSIPAVTVRIAAIAHRSEWRVAGGRGQYIGIEIGSELFPLLDLGHV